MSPKLQLAVIGCGRISHSHLEAVQQLPDTVDLVGVADTQIERAQAAQTRYGAQKWYASATDAFNDRQVEAAVICLPHDLHHPIALQALRSGKHVLVEKPMALTARQADEMVAVAKESARKLMVGQSRRFYNAVMRSKALVEEGEIGAPIHISATYFHFMDQPPTPWWSSAERTGGLLIPLWGSHLVDYVLWIYQAKPIRVTAEASRHHAAWEGEDEVSALLGFKEGGMATIQLSWNVRQGAPVGQDSKRMLAVTGSQRYERIVVGTEGTLHLRGETELVLNGQEVPLPPQDLSNFAHQLIEFANAIRQDREPLTSGAAVRDTVEVLEAMSRSSEEGRVVYLDEPNSRKAL